MQKVTYTFTFANFCVENIPSSLYTYAIFKTEDRIEMLEKLAGTSSEM